MKMFYVGTLVNAVEVSFKNKETGNVNISKKLILPTAKIKLNIPTFNFTSFYGTIHISSYMRNLFI